MPAGVTTRWLSTRSPRKKSNYEVIFREEWEAKQREIDKVIEEMREEVLQKQKDLSDMQRYVETVEQERVKEKDKRMRVEQEMLEQAKGHEAEVKLRLQFETKLNHMHAVHRELNYKYRDALVQIDSFIQDKELLKRGNKEIGDQLNEQRVENVELKTKLEHTIDKTVTLDREIKAKNKFVENLTERFQEMIREKDNIEYKKNLYFKDIDILKSKIQILEGKPNIFTFRQTSMKRWRN
jgi:chromosome segregation ATPase